MILNGVYFEESGWSEIDYSVVGDRTRKDLGITDMVHYPVYISICNWDLKPPKCCQYLVVLRWRCMMIPWFDDRPHLFPINVHDTIYRKEVITRFGNKYMEYRQLRFDPRYPGGRVLIDTDHTILRRIFE